MDITIQAALPHQAAELSAIALKAKGHWGYSSAQLERWRTEFLTITAEYIAANQVWVACVAAPRPVGFAALERHGGQAVLEHLWVLPDYIGKGVGRRLFEHVAAAVPRFTFTSDPHADDFYYRMGAQKIGEQESTLQNRMLTVFEYIERGMKI
jgi:GNAT superfamily N-acetyltransferase